MNNELKVGLLAHDHVQSVFSKSICDHFNRCCINVEVSGRYNEMKEAILEAAEEHLKCGRRLQKGTLKYQAKDHLGEGMAFIRWQ